MPHPGDVGKVFLLCASDSKLASYGEVRLGALLRSNRWKNARPYCSDNLGPYPGRINCICIYYHWSTRKLGKRIKEQVVCFAIPQYKVQLQDYHRLHPAFTMMLSKPVVSFIAAFAVATGVSAAATPMARGNGYPPAINQSQCNVGSVSCCTSSVAQSDPQLASLLGLVGLPVGLNAILGLTCVNILGSTQW